MKRLILLFLITVSLSSYISLFALAAPGYEIQNQQSAYPQSAVSDTDVADVNTADNSDKSGNQGNISADYRQFPVFGSRLAVWFVGQLHLMFAAFILGVPIFAVIVEFIGIKTKKPRYDRMAKEFTKLTMAAFSTTAILGALLVFLFVGFYPKFFGFLSGVFHNAFWVYALLFFGETFMLYLYRYSWDKLKDNKIRHLTYGIVLNIFGIAVMVMANSWVSFMISPAGIDDNGKLLSLFEAITNFTWMPLNIHRFIANICFGGAIVAAFASFKFLTAGSRAEKAYYDWEGYIGNFIAISAFIALPFAGYLLTKEIYEYNQQLGISLMGGFLSWLWIIQAVLIGSLFLGTNYYLWLGMERIPGAERYQGYIKYLIGVLAFCFMIWATPHTLVASFIETQRMGGAHHPLVGFLGVMSAKNTAVNMMILATFISFLLYRRSNKISTASWVKIGSYSQIAILTVSCTIVIFYGIYGYFVEARIRVGFSIYQVSAVIFAIVSLTVIDIFLYRKSKAAGTIRWGEIPSRSQYTLLLIAVTFTWLMGLMGFARSAMRQHWHIYGVLKDTSVDAYTPAIGYAANVVSIITIVFIALVMLIFWLGTLGEEKGISTGFEPVGDCGSVIGGCAFLKTFKNTVFGVLKPAASQCTAHNDSQQTSLGISLSQIENPKSPAITLLKGFGFSVAVIGIFTLYANSIPQLESKVPEEMVISGETLTPESIVQMGKSLFSGKGNCYVCHKDDTTGRGPNLNNIGSAASARKPDCSSKDYILESLVNPASFVVEGFSPIMPAANKPPISLNQAELLALTAYLESLGGIVTVTSDDIQAAVSIKSSALSSQLAAHDEIYEIEGVISMGEIIYKDRGCHVCHLTEGDDETVGPNLRTIGSRAGKEYIKESILDPDAKIIEGFKFKMPKDYQDKLTVKEFSDLMVYLMSLKR